MTAAALPAQAVAAAQEVVRAPPQAGGVGRGGVGPEVPVVEVGGLRGLEHRAQRARLHLRLRTRAGAPRGAAAGVTRGSRSRGACFLRRPESAHPCDSPATAAANYRAAWSPAGHCHAARCWQRASIWTTRAAQKHAGFGGNKESAPGGSRGCQHSPIRTAARW